MHLGGLQVSMILMLDTYNPGFSEAEGRLTYQAAELAITALREKNATQVFFTSFNHERLLSAKWKNKNCF